LYSDCLEKIILTADHLNIAKKQFFKTVPTFLQLCICELETELDLDPDSNPDQELITDPDPNLQIILGPDPDAKKKTLATGILELKYWHLAFPTIFKQSNI
jgi:hypothetical protein